MSAEKQISTADERSSFVGGKSVQFRTLSCILDQGIRLMDLRPWEMGRGRRRCSSQ